ncbi:MAG TPA: hypothetical protein VEH81_14170, partial [Ktedonobacteraceae bacterium]|nr:hypothetical protein [Ktedonobacteraceae bacterium]
LVAYEAGRAMASLSWGSTITIIPIETKVSQAPKNNELAQELVQAWQQVSALSTAMDDAYYRVHPDVSRPNPNNPAERTNLALPSQTIQAVTFSLEYWKRAVQRICSDQPQTNQENLPPGDAKKPGANSATPGSNGAQKIIAIPGMTGDTSKALRLALVQQAEIWQPLLLHQQSLLDFTTQYVTQHILNDFMNECERATAQEIQNEIKKFRVPFIVGGGVILLLLVSIILLFIVFPGSYQTLASGFALIIGGIVGFFGTVAARLSSIFSRSPSSAVTSQGSAGPLTAIPGLAGAALVGAFQDGYNQILVDFDYLNHNISITYPLVEFFIFQSVLRAQEITEKKAIVNTTQVSTTTSNSIFQRIASFFATRDKKSPNTIPTTEVEAVVVETIKDAYDFLTQIVWTNQDRADEIARVARAAFGPIGAFVGAQISLLSAQNNKSATKKK